MVHAPPLHRRPQVLRVPPVVQREEKFATWKSSSNRTGNGYVLRMLVPGAARSTAEAP